MTPTEIILIIAAVITCILAIGSTILMIRELLKDGELMSKYVIKVITEVDNGCFVEEYYKGIDENDNVVLTEDLAEAALFDEEETCDSIIDHLCVVLDYMPRAIEKERR